MEHIVKLSEGQLTCAFVKDGVVYSETIPLTTEINALFEVMHTAHRTQMFLKDPIAYKLKYNIV